jgi:hypothetical protein
MPHLTYRIRRAEPAIVAGHLHSFLSGACG